MFKQDSLTLDEVTFIDGEVKRTGMSASCITDYWMGDMRNRTDLSTYQAYKDNCESNASTARAAAKECGLTDAGMREAERNSRSILQSEITRQTAIKAWNEGGMEEDLARYLSTCHDKMTEEEKVEGLAAWREMHPAPK